MAQEWKYGLENNGNTCFINAGIQLIINCVQELGWLNSTNSDITNKLQELINSKGDNEKLIEFCSLLVFNGSKSTSRFGGDPVRILAAFIDQSKQAEEKVQITYNTGRLQNDYEYWASDNSLTSFLFQSVYFNGVVCSNCSQSYLFEEEQTFVFSLSKHQIIENSIQQSLSKKVNFSVGLDETPQDMCSCQPEGREKVKGFLKLPKFLLINIDEKIDRKTLTIENNIQINDQSRQINLDYELKGFICFAPFHYTYFKHLEGDNWRHFNDNYVEEVNTTIRDQVPKILLYSCSSRNQDKNIQALITQTCEPNNNQYQNEAEQAIPQIETPYQKIEENSNSTDKKEEADDSQQQVQQQQQQPTNVIIEENDNLQARNNKDSQLQQNDEESFMIQHIDENRILYNENHNKQDNSQQQSYFKIASKIAVGAAAAYAVYWVFNKLF